MCLWSDIFPHLWLGLCLPPGPRELVHKWLCFLSFPLTRDSQFIGAHSMFSGKHLMNKQVMIRHANERQAREKKYLIFGNNTFCNSSLLPFSSFVLPWDNQKAWFCRQCKTYFKSMFAGNMGKLLPLRSSFAYLWTRRGYFFNNNMHNSLRIWGTEWDSVPID